MLKSVRRLCRRLCLALALPLVVIGPVTSAELDIYWPARAKPY